jgi:hypothetical protein
MTKLYDEFDPLRQRPCSVDHPKTRIARTVSAVGGAQTPCARIAGREQ